MRNNCRHFELAPFLSLFLVSHAGTRRIRLQGHRLVRFLPCPICGTCFTIRRSRSADGKFSRLAFSEMAVFVQRFVKISRSTFSRLKNLIYQRSLNSRRSCVAHRQRFYFVLFLSFAFLSCPLFWKFSYDN